MITVTPIQNKADQEALCAQCAIPFRVEHLAYRAENDGVFAGVCQFRIDREGGHLTDLACPVGHTDAESLFVMGRAALNFMDLCGAVVAHFEGGTPLAPALLTRIGFCLGEDGVYRMDLKGFFEHPCSHAAH